MVVSIIVATDEQGVIGKDNVIPWHMPADMLHFRKITTGHPVIMGRKTFESIGRPLPERQNIVVSRNAKFKAEGVQVTDTIERAIALAVVSHVNEIFIIGGQDIYDEALPKADKIYLTKIHAKVKGDRTFKYRDDQWRVVSTEKHQMDELNPYDYDFVLLEKVR